MSSSLKDLFEIQRSYSHSNLKRIFEQCLTSPAFLSKARQPLSQVPLGRTLGIPDQFSKFNICN